MYESDQSSLWNEMLRHINFMRNYSVHCLCAWCVVWHGTRSAVLEMQSTGIGGGKKGSAAAAEDCMECVPRAFHVFILLPILAACHKFMLTIRNGENAFEECTHLCCLLWHIAKWERRAELIVCPVNYCHTNWIRSFAWAHTNGWRQARQHTQSGGIKPTQAQSKRAKSGQMTAASSVRSIQMNPDSLPDAGSKWKKIMSNMCKLRNSLKRAY